MKKGKKKKKIWESSFLLRVVAVMGIIVAVVTVATVAVVVVSSQCG